MQQGYCKNCKYWEATSRGMACDRVNHNYNASDPTRFETYARAADDTDLTVWLFTGPEFSCIHFTQIPNQSSD